MKKILFLLLVLFPPFIYGQRLPSGMQGRGEFKGFIQNVGQVRTIDGAAADYVLFYLQSPALDVFITNDGLTYNFKEFYSVPNPDWDSRIHKEDSLKTMIRYRRVDVHLNNALIKKEQIDFTRSKSAPRIDFYTEKNSDGLLDVPQAERILIKNIYPKIDWELLVIEGRVKYNFILHPGADISLISQKFIGASELKMEKDGLLVSTELGSFREGKLLAYEEGTMKEVQMESVLSENNLSYRFLSVFSSDKNIIIDPPLAWSTYYGGSGADDAHAIERNFSGDIYIGGKCASVDFPLKDEVSGLTYYQGTYASGTDAFISRFSEDGVWKWSTYYGGTGLDDILRLSLSSVGLFASGYTTSTDFPCKSFTALPGAYNVSTFAGGTHDGFVIAFAADQLIWGSYLGGDSMDWAEDVVFKQNKLIITGFTKSANFPVINPGGSSYYRSAKGSPTAVDQFITEFNVGFQMVWSTYIGGDGPSGDTYVDMDSDGNIVTAGCQYANNLALIDPGSGAYQQARSGLCDIIIQKFTPNRQLVWRTFLGGANTNYYEMPKELLIDTLDRYWLVGGSSATNFPTVNAIGAPFYQSTSLGSTDALIAVFSKDGNYLYSTRFGGTGIDAGWGITIDEERNVYITGETSSNNFSPRVNPNDAGYYQNNFGGGVADGFLVRLDSNFTARWGTYLGGTGEDRIRNIRTNSNNHVFITGYTKSTNFPTANYLAGSYFDNTLGSASVQDAFVARFIPCPDDFTDIVAEDSICFNDNAQLVAVGDPSLYGSYSFVWNTGETNDTISHAVSSDVWYHVTSTGLYACTERDSIKITVKPLPIVSFSGDNEVCFGDSAKLIVGGGMHYLWENGSVDTAYNYIPVSTEYQSVSVTNNFNCSKIDSVKVTVHALPSFSVNGNYSFCKMDTTVLKPIGAGNYNYTWSTGSSNDSLILTSASAGTFPFWVLALDSNTCRDTVSIPIVVFELPLFSLGNDTTLCNGQSLVLDPGLAGLNYLWNNADITQTLSLSSAGTYSLTITDANTCHYSDTISISQIPYSNASISPVLPRCLNEVDTLQLHGAEPGGLWIGSGISDPNIGVFHVGTLNAGSYVIEYQMAGICGDTGSVVITLNPAPIVNLGADRPFCEGDSVLLNAANAGSDFLWNTGATTQQVYASNTMLLWVEVENSYGCKNRDSVQVEEFPWANAEVTDPLPVCANIPGNLSFVSAQSGGVWSGSGVIDPSAGIFSPSLAGPGNHSVVYSIGGLCPDADTAVWQIYDVPVSTISVVDESCAGAANGQVYIQANGGLMPYLYTLNGVLASDSNRSLPPGVYLLVVEDANHCSSSDSVEVKPEDFPCGEIGGYIPNIFSPNGDGKNDELRVYSNFIKSMEWVVYDRLGEKIFESIDPAVGWDGTFQGQRVQPGLYVYYLRVVLITDEVISRQGNVTLVR